MSVLILEDNRQILNVLEELVLSVSDEKVYATDDVGEAYKIAMENSVDVFYWILFYMLIKRGYIGNAVCANLYGSWSVTVLHLLFYYFIRRPGNVCFAGFARFWIY